MRAVLQRVHKASVRIVEESQETTVGAIDAGMLVLVGVERGDGLAEAAALAGKLAHLRIFEDDRGRMNRNAEAVGGAFLIVSQFTLAGRPLDRGRRPSFNDAAPPDQAAPLVDAVVEALRARGLTVATGRFGAQMRVDLVNDGPVTFVLDVP